MKRNLDLIRSMMLALEANGELNGRSSLFTTATDLFSDLPFDDDVLAYHLMLIIEEGWLTGKYESVGGDFIIQRLTTDGHDFIEATRHPSIWDQAKAAMRAGGTETLRFAWSVSKQIAQKEIEKRLGLGG